MDIPDPNSEKQPESRTVIHVLVKPCPVRMSWGSLMLCMMMLRSAVKNSSSSSRGAKRKLGEDSVPAAKVASKVTGAGKHPRGKPLRETYEQRWSKYGVKWQKKLPRLVWHVVCILRITSNVVSNPLVLVVVIMLALFCGQSSGVVIRLSRSRKHLCELHGWPTRRGSGVGCKVCANVCKAAENCKAGYGRASRLAAIRSPSSNAGSHLPASCLIERVHRRALKLWTTPDLPCV